MTSQIVSRDAMTTVTRDGVGPHGAAELKNTILYVEGVTVSFDGFKALRIEETALVEKERQHQAIAASLIDNARVQRCER